MQIYMIEPDMTMECTTQAEPFAHTVKAKLESYASVNCVNSFNINMYEGEINENSFIILFNDKSDRKMSENIQNFLNTAKKKKSSIFPIALQKETRMPAEKIAEYQSYDVYEQLRCRNLEDTYLSSIAEDCVRKIISRTMPMLYSNSGLIFVSHRRLDGEEITANLCDRIKQQSKQSNVFRDIINVQVGEAAQNVIDKAMENSDAFLFIHTEKSAESVWIQKELKYALLKSIPVVWIRIENADISKLRIKPAENPNLEYHFSDFESEERLVKITDEILQTVFEAIMRRNREVFVYLNSIKSLFGDRIKEIQKTNLIYEVTVPRKNYQYPQRDIVQYFQLYGRTPLQTDIDNYKEIIRKKGTAYDSALILNNSYVERKNYDPIIGESWARFYDNWSRYLKGQGKEENMEIIISGAFPDGDEICKQSLTDALIIFASAVIRDGYCLTFGSHPTFQEIFFEVAKEAETNDSKQKLKMYISKCFEDQYTDQKEHFKMHANLIETQKKGSVEKSLSDMRKKMIQRRKEVAALICLGGKIKEDKSQEGIREEIRLAQEAKIPVFVAGTVGGCSSVVAAENKASGWKELNEAPWELNRMFMEDLDYFCIVRQLLDYLDR